VIVTSAEASACGFIALRSGSTTASLPSSPGRRVGSAVDAVVVPHRPAGPALFHLLDAAGVDHAAARRRVVASRRFRTCWESSRPVGARLRLANASDFRADRPIPPIPPVPPRQAAVSPDPLQGVAAGATALRGDHQGVEREVDDGRRRQVGESPGGRGGGYGNPEVRRNPAPPPPGRSPVVFPLTHVRSPSTFESRIWPESP
jgi:hypothetical protein